MPPSRPAADRMPAAASRTRMGVATQMPRPVRRMGSVRPSAAAASSNVDVSRRRVRQRRTTPPGPSRGEPDAAGTAAAYQLRRHCNAARRSGRISPLSEWDATAGADAGSKRGVCMSQVRNGIRRRRLVLPVVALAALLAAGTAVAQDGEGQRRSRAAGASEPEPRGRRRTGRSCPTDGPGVRRPASTSTRPTVTSGSMTAAGRTGWTAGAPPTRPSIRSSSTTATRASCWPASARGSSCCRTACTSTTTATSGSPTRRATARSATRSSSSAPRAKC